MLTKKMCVEFIMKLFFEGFFHLFDGNFIYFYLEINNTKDMRSQAWVSANWVKTQRKKTKVKMKA